MPSISYLLISIGSPVLAKRRMALITLFIFDLHVYYIIVRSQLVLIGVHLIDRRSEELHHTLGT